MPLRKGCWYSLSLGLLSPPRMYLVILLLLVRSSRHVGDASYPSSNLGELVSALLALQLLTWLSGRLFASWLPHLLLANWDMAVCPGWSPGSLWEVQPVHLGSNFFEGRRWYTFAVRPRLPWRTNQHTFSYCGGLSSATGRPDGYGEWVDSSRYGESIRCVLREGRPCTPFTTREVGSGCGFVGIQAHY